MAKVPGVTLQHTYSKLSSSEKKRVKKASSVAIKAVHDCGVHNGSPHLVNVIWCKEDDKCYIIDFERATFNPDDFVRHPALWGMY